MKLPAQLTCSTIFVAIVFKSFIKEVSIVDAVILIAVSCIFAMYEFIQNRETNKELSIYKEATDKHLNKLEEDLQNTRNHISKFTASQVLRR